MVAQRGGTAQIPTQSRARLQPAVPADLYRKRNLVERFFCKLIQFRRIATSFEKHAGNFPAAVALAAVRIGLRSIETTSRALVASALTPMQPWPGSPVEDLPACQRALPPDRRGADADSRVDFGDQVLAPKGLHMRAIERRLPATAYLREILARGHDGGISILMEWLAEPTPAPPTPQVIRVELSPGRRAQVDLTAIRRGDNKPSAFVGRPGFRRLSFVWFADNERLDRLIEAQELSLDALGGVPHTILSGIM